MIKFHECTKKRLYRNETFPLFSWFSEFQNLESFQENPDRHGNVLLESGNIDATNFMSICIDSTVHCFQYLSE